MDLQEVLPETKTHKLSGPTMLAYGVGQLAEAIKNIGFSTFLLFYYNQVIGVSATKTSIVLAIALVLDAITDPVAGTISDKFDSRFGRRHPFLLAASIPLAITFYFLFHPPEFLSDTGIVIWLLVFAVLVRMSMTVYHVPHLALGAEMARDYNQRSTLYALSTFFQLSGAAIFLPLSYYLFFPTTEEFNPALLNQAAYTPWALFAGAGIVLSIWLCVLGTASEIPRMRQNAPVEREKISPKKLITEIWSAFQNKSFRAIFFGLILATFILAVENVFNPFMDFHFWGMTTEQLKLKIYGSITGLTLAIVLIPVATKKLDKKPTLIISALLVIININTPIILMLSGVSWFPEPGSQALLYILIASAFVTALLAPIIFATVTSMFADITDEYELQSGKRQEGVIFAARAFALKATSSFGLIAGGLLLDYIAFPRGAQLGEVPEDVTWWLGFIAGPATSIFTFCGMYLYMGYKIDRKRHQEILNELMRRKYKETKPDFPKELE